MEYSMNKSMTYVKLNITLISLFIIACNISCVNQSDQTKVYFGIDAELYKNTPAWNLVQALDMGNYSLASEEMNKDSSLANFIEPKYGNSVLLWAVLNSNEKAVDFLLKSGSNVNKSNLFGDSPLEIAAFYNDRNSIILKKLIDHQPKNDSLSSYLRDKALIAASKNCLNNVKLLINNGANPNWDSKTAAPVVNHSPLSAAVVNERYDIVEYYLIELNVNPSTGSIIGNDGDTITITELLKKSYNTERIFDHEKTRQQIRKILDYLELKEE